MGSHLRWAAQCREQFKQKAAAAVPRARQKRHRPTINFKCEVLVELKELEEAGAPFPVQLMLAVRPDLSRSCLYRWVQDQESIFIAQARGHGSRRNVMTKGRQWFPASELMVYYRFVWRRKVRGLKVSDEWVQREMLSILKEFQPEGWRLLSCSRGWLGGFKKRYHISSQVRTNKKAVSIHEKLPRIKKFHKWLLHDLQRQEPQRCARYGRFPARFMFHMDQVPLAFVLDCSRTLNGVGEEVFLVQPGSGLDKRQVTIQLTIRAEGEQLVRPLVIIRGTGIRVNAEEQLIYQTVKDRVRVIWQPKAWADEAVCLIWLEQFAADVRQVLPEGEILLGMDGHKPQKTAKMLARMRELGITPVYTPPETTDCTAPVDHHVTSRIKQFIAKSYHEALDENRDDWMNSVSEGGLEAWQRRALMVMWVATAWQELKTDAAFLRKAFISTGFLIAKDGSENHLIKVPGHPEYDFTQP